MSGDDSFVIDLTEEEKALLIEALGMATLFYYRQRAYYFKDAGNPKLGIPLDAKADKIDLIINRLLTL